MHRLATLIVALLIGAAAPARVWCEASCLAPSSTGEHCPTHEPASADTAIAAAVLDNCPVIESARPIPSRLEFDLASAVATYVAPSAPSHRRTPGPSHLRTPAPSPLRLIPLRI